MQIVFQDDFDHGLQISPGDPSHWTDGKWQKGAKYELVDYPGRGKVFKAYVSGDRFLEGGFWWRRAQVSWGIGPYDSLVTTPAPCAVSCDVWVSKALALKVRGGPGLGLLSVHTPYTESRLPGYSTGFEIWDGTTLVIGHHDDTDQIEYRTCDAVRWSAEKWFNLMLLFESDGRVLPFVNGTLAIRDPTKALVIYPGFDIGFGDTHAGLYGGHKSKTPDWPEGAFLLNDNFRVVRFLG